MNTRLFVIEGKCSSGPCWWHCSAAHGSGWHDKYPKQAFSKSELLAQLGRLIEREYLPAVITIKMLQMPRDGGGEGGA